MTKTCEELALLAEKYAGECAGLELEQICESCLEVTAAEGVGLGGTTYELSNSYVRTCGDRVGYARAEGLDPSIEELVDEAVAQSRTVDLSEPAGAMVVPEAPEEACMPAAEPLPAAEDLARVAQEAVDRLSEKAGNHRAVKCAVRAYEQRRLVSNSKGLSRACTHRHVMALLSYIAVGQKEMHNVMVRSFAAEAGDIDIDELVERALLIGEASLDGATIESGEYPVVFSGEVVCQMLVGFWQLFSGEKIATHQSFLDGKLGERIGADALTVCDGAAAAWGGPGYLPIDAQGVAHKDRKLVDRGVFVSPLTTCEWARELGFDESFGNADRRDTMGRIVPNDLTVVPANLAIAPGDDSLEELFAKMGDGIYVTDIADIYHSFNIASGGVSTPVRGAWVRGGKLAEPISAMSLSCNLKDLFANVVACSNHLAWVDMEDLNAYWCGAPDMLISQVGLVGAIEA